MTFVVLGFAVMIAVQLIENYTTGATAVTGTGVSMYFIYVFMWSIRIKTGNVAVI